VKQALRTTAAYVLPPLAAFSVLIAFWEAYVSWRDISLLVMPPPSEVAEKFFERPGHFWEEGAWTMYEATLGLMVGSAVALAMAVLMAHSRVVERAVFPLAIAAKVAPIVAISPVLVIMFGFGMEPKIIVAALLCFFPTVVNATAGFRDVDPRALEFFRSINASPWHIFWKLRVPGSLPYIMSALKITYPLALTGAVVAEWFSGTRGLGYVIFSSSLNLRTAELWASIGVLAVMGVAIYAALTLVERRLLFWHESVRSTS
jgi:NitT/TauT family transport system permease protein